MNKKNKAKRIIFVAATILITLILQTTVFRMVPYCNTTPNLLLIAACSFGLLRGRTKGIWIGFVCGLLVDLFYGGQIIGFYALVYMYIGYLNGLLSEMLLKDTVLVPILFCFGSEIIYHSYVYVFSYLLRRRLGFTDYLVNIMAPEVVYTMVCMVALYGVILWINRILTDAERKGEIRVA